MAQQPQVAIIGMKALRRDVKKLTGRSGDLDKALSAAGRVAAAPVASTARSRLPQVTGRLAGDVRVTASRSGAAVRMGRSNLRYAGWVEFGGTRRVPHVSTRDYNPRGRYLFPAALQLASTSARIYSSATQAALDNFDWTNSGTGSVHD
jgi:Bacteriophage HK97-gp10, putative tail-component